MNKLLEIIEQGANKRLLFKKSNILKLYDYLY